VSYVCATTAAAAADKKSQVSNATAVAGQPVVLNCVMPVTHRQQHVVWLRPTDGLPVPLHTHSTQNAANYVGPAARFVLIGNATTGQHHLLIHYTVFVEDAGRWTCVSVDDSHLVQHIQLMILVPPPSQVRFMIVMLHLAQVTANLMILVPPHSQVRLMICSLSQVRVGFCGNCGMYISIYMLFRQVKIQHIYCVLCSCAYDLL